jgi:outer membrane lipoprotein SlyB
MPTRTGADGKTMIRRLSLTAIVLALGLAGCGSSSHSSSGTGASAGSHAENATQVALEPAQRAALTFTKDAGQAFTTFDRAIYTPYQQGAFNPAKPNRAVLASAGQTAVVVAKEIHEAALATAESPQLAALKAPMVSLDEGFQAALVKLKQGHFDFGEIQAAAVAIASIRGAAASAGLSIPG